MAGGYCPAGLVDGLPEASLLLLIVPLSACLSSLGCECGARSSACLSWWTFFPPPPSWVVHHHHHHPQCLAFSPSLTLALTSEQVTNLECKWLWALLLWEKPSHFLEAL